MQGVTRHIMVHCARMRILIPAPEGNGGALCFTSGAAGFIFVQLLVRIRQTLEVK